MRHRVLKLAICGPSGGAQNLSEVVTEVSSSLISSGPDAPRIDVRVIGTRPADENIARTHHLVVDFGQGKSNWSDLSIDSATEMAALSQQRLVPWVTKWQEGRRAPRALRAVLARSDPAWPFAAARLIARIHTHLDGQPVLRVDHIGSTSVPGMAAKNLIDIQVIVPSDDQAANVAQAVTNAGFVHVSGEWHGKDRDGQLHPEQVCVDSDPGRPVNINIRSAKRPVARDALLFRDWLRDNSDAKDRYLAMKKKLVGGHVDDYGDGKEPFISTALVEAEAWAARAGWALDL